MPRISIVLVLVTMIPLVACGGGQRMTIQEYATACGGLGDKFASDSLSPGAALEDALAEAKQWNPPEELQRLHELLIEGYEAGIKALKDTGLLDLMQEFEEAQQNDDQERLLELMAEMEEAQDGMDALGEQMEEVEEDIAQAERDLSPEARKILEDVGCI